MATRKKKLTGSETNGITRATFVIEAALNSLPNATDDLKFVLIAFSPKEALTNRGKGRVLLLSNMEGNLARKFLAGAAPEMVKRTKSGHTISGKIKSSAS